jgi:16S rRNA (adenine1518-N6/adenine1519-N6)-dimethyltransferase
MARQRLGQHFLGNDGWREQIAEAIDLRRPHTGGDTNSSPEDWCWLEVGAGHGEMTEHLVQGGAPVFALELDKPLIERLNRLAAKHSNLTVVPGDVLQADLSAITGGRQMRIYGNLPYYITSPILHRFFEFAGLIEEIHVVIQQEVAERLTASPGNKAYGYLSVATQFYTRPEFVFQLPADAFQPPPEVDSALVSMRLPGASAKLNLRDGPAFLDFVKTCFAQKRKTLTNNLRGLVQPEQTRTVLKALDIRGDARAEQLSVLELAALYSAISSARSAVDQDNQT